MKSVIQYTISRSDGGYIAEGVDVPVVTQGKTLDELTENIKEATELLLEDSDPSEFGIAANHSVAMSFELSHRGHDET